MKNKTYDLIYNQFKTRVNAKKLEWQYVETPLVYEIFAEDGGITYRTFVYKTSAYTQVLGINQTANDADLNDFEANYKNISNDPINLGTKLNTSYSGGRPVVRAESRPDNTVTHFTTRGDSPTALGDGNRFEWDFSNTDNDVATPPAGHKQKHIDVTFADPIYVKEGTIYFHNAPKGCSITFYIICPDQQYYVDRSGNPQQASGDVIVERYVNDHPLQGSVPMGDELNTEAATINAVPAGYIFRLEVTTPDTDSTSNGVAELELYRTRTYLLPGESI